MTDTTVVHHTFSLERRYPAPVSDVFAAWADPRAKRRLFSNDKGDHELDFRIGGREVVKSVGDNGKVLAFESRYLDIVEGERIVYVSTLSADSELATASITSVDLHAEGGVTVLVLTESDVLHGNVVTLIGDFRARYRARLTRIIHRLVV